MRLVLLSLTLAVMPNLARAVERSIVEHGAIPGGETLCTVAIQQAIDEVAAQGGGTVCVPEGVFLTGSLFLKPDVDLHLAEGAVLLGSQRLEDYPKQRTRIEGHFEPWTSALINGKDLEGVKITGSGTLDGNGRPFWIAFWKRRAENPKCTNLEVERPRLMFLENCRDVTIKGLRFKDSGFWNLHLYKCQEVLVEGVSIRAPHGAPPRIVGADQPWDEISVDRAPSSDGIDIDSCQHVVIRCCTISNGDDCIALKGTKGPLALEDETSPPVEDILIEDCDFQSGHGMLTCGSEATIVRDVVVRNCKVGANVPIIRLKLRPDTPQLYENLLFENIESLDAQALFAVNPWTQFFDLQGHEPPRSIVRNLRVKGVRGSMQSLGILRGNPGDVIEDVVIEDSELRVAKAAMDTNAQDEIKVRNVSLNGQPFTLP